MNHATYTSYFIIYMSLIITFIPNQTDHPEINQSSKHSTVSPSTSLRLRGLAQARQSRSGESPSAQARAQTGTGKQHGISLRRDPSRLGELCARSKTHPGRLSDHSRRKLWASLCTSRLGESISVCHCSHLHNAYTHPTEIPASPDIHSNSQSQRIRKPHQYKPKHTTRKGSSFPYLEYASIGLNGNHGTTTLGHAQEMKQTTGQITRQAHYGFLAKTNVKKHQKKYEQGWNELTRSDELIRAHWMRKAAKPQQSSLSRSRRVTADL